MFKFKGVSTFPATVEDEFHKFGRLMEKRVKSQRTWKDQPNQHCVPLRRGRWCFPHFGKAIHHNRYWSEPGGNPNAKFQMLIGWFWGRDSRHRIELGNWAGSSIASTKQIPLIGTRYRTPCQNHVEITKMPARRSDSARFSWIEQTPNYPNWLPIWFSWKRLREKHNLI